MLIVFSNQLFGKKIIREIIFVKNAFGKTSKPFQKLLLHYFHLNCWTLSSLSSLHRVRDLRR